MLGRRLVGGRVPHVCVIGAGMSGLRCAEVLLTNGIKVTILEGRDRIGGRIHQVNHAGHLFDMGPNWIHGTNNNPILDLAQETKSSLHSWPDNMNVLDETGHLLSPKRAKGLVDGMWAIIDDASKYSHDHTDSIPPERSLFDFFLSKVGSNDVQVNGGTAIDEYVQRQTPNHEEQQLLWTAEMWGAFVGDPITRQSLKFFWLEECLEGENKFLASTYKSILDRVAKMPLEEADLRFSTKVTKIETGGSVEGTPSTAVTTVDGEVHRFDEVVVTAPLGWLKRNKQAFEPPLDENLSSVIDSISYGHLEKVLITFSKPFWRDGANGEASINGSGPSREDDGQFGDFTAWIHPQYATESNPQCWTMDAVDLAALPEPHSQPALLFYIQGPCSAYITSLISKQPPSQHHALLETFFEPYYSRLPKYDPSSPECIPVAFLATNWSNDELAGYGSYSNFQVGLTTGDDDIEIMRKGLPERHLWLAGEHTAPFVALGTTTGAYWSGEGVAQRIIEAYGSTRKDEETYSKTVEKEEPEMMPDDR